MRRSRLLPFSAISIMEITILEALPSLPSKPVLAIHAPAGGVRRQAKLEVNQPIVVPYPCALTGKMEVTLFNQMASGFLLEENSKQPDGASTCSLPVRRTDGEASQVKLGVRRGPNKESDRNASLLAQDSISVTRDYLEHHQLQARIQNLIQDVLGEQPANPYRFMLERLQATQAARGSKRKEGVQTIASPSDEEGSKTSKTPEAIKPKAPVVPRPPDSTKPKMTGRSLAPANRAQLCPPVRRHTNNPALAVASVAISMVLRMPACLEVVTESLRNVVQQIEARKLGASIISSTKRKLLNKAASTSTSRDQARASINLMLRRAGSGSLENNRAALLFTKQVAFNGAVALLASNHERRLQNLTDKYGESLPTPFVNLNTEMSWGSALGGRGGYGGKA